MPLELKHGSEPPPGWRGLARTAGLFYHEPGWILALHEAFGWSVHFLSAWSDERLVGILPLAEVRTLLGRRRLVSLPFSYAAGPVASEPAAVVALAEAARQIAGARGIRTVELKSLGLDAPLPGGFQRVTKYSTYVVETGGGERAVWGRLHPGSTQRSIRKAQRGPLRVERGSSVDDWLEIARLQESTAHRHGTPPPPRSFFTRTCRRLQADGLADLYLARGADAQAAAAIVLWKGARRWIYAFGGARPEQLEHRPNHLLLWTALQQAIEAGVDFDLGRAAPEQGGLVEFKMRWGGQPIPLAYDYWPGVSGLHSMPRDRGPIATFGRVWSRLPERVTRAGSVLYRYLG